MISLSNKIKQTFNLKNTKPHRTLLFIMTALFAISFGFSGLARADSFQAQINSLNAENGNLQTQRQELQSEAASLEAVINGLQAQIDELTAQINANQARMDALKAQIAQTEAEVVKQRGLLGDNIRAMYLEGDISTFEMLMSSKDLGEYMDKEQYRNSVQSKVKATLDKINELRAKLEKDRAEVEKTLVDQKSIQGQLDAQRAEQARLLALNEGERNELNGQIKANTSKISDLRRQQAAANARIFGGRGTINVPDSTGYPWAGVGFPNTSADPWGMYKRQCVSYTAWKVWKSGRHMPYWGGFGNANQWDDNARRAGIPVDGNPRVGDVAVSNSGYYGHVMYVEAVYGDGTIYVSQYNANWQGTYSEARVPIGNLQFIHF